MDSIIFVAYRNSGYIEDNLKKLEGLRDMFEIILAADEPDSEIYHLIDKYNKRYCLKNTLSRTRRGKWKALNDAVSIATGDYLIFIDSDTRIVDFSWLESFIRCKNLEESVDRDFYYDYDAIEIRKEINSSSVIEKLANLDYFNMHIISKFASKLNSCLGLNGAAFIIRREVLYSLGGFKDVINEDTDLGIRLGLNEYKVGVLGKALTKAPSTMKGWFTQRERWSIGGAELFFENKWEILKKPKLWIPSLLLLYPALVGMLVNILVQDNIVLTVLYFLFPFMLFLPHKILVLFLLAVFEYHLIKNLFVILVPFFIWVVIVLILSKKVEYRIEYRYLPIYFFIYSPIWTLICLTSVVKVFIYRLLGKRPKVRGWVV